jgi:hypothetical protein
MRLLKAFEAFTLHRRRFVSTAGLALVAASQSGLGVASAEPKKMDAVQVKSNWNGGLCRRLDRGFP